MSAEGLRARSRHPAGRSSRRWPVAEIFGALAFSAALATAAGVSLMCERSAGSLDLRVGAVVPEDDPSILASVVVQATRRIAKPPQPRPLAGLSLRN